MSDEEPRALTVGSWVVLLDEPHKGQRAQVMGYDGSSVLVQLDGLPDPPTQVPAGRVKLEATGEAVADVGGG
jgi:hypothetical protein